MSSFVGTLTEDDAIKMHPLRWASFTVPGRCL